MINIPHLCRIFHTFIIDTGISKIAALPHEDRVSLTFTTLARNSPLSLAIAVSAFSGQPLIALALVIGPLIELPVLSLTSYIMYRLPASNRK